MATFIKRIAQGSDDAEQKINTGAMELASSDLEMVEESSKQTVGLRWDVVTIPQGATIDSATITFIVDEADIVSTDLTFRGEDINDAPTFISSAFNISDRTPTTASVSWNSSSTPAMVSWIIDDTHTTPDLKTIVQEVIDRAGWVEDNAIAFIITGTAGSKRVAFSFEGDSAKAALLTINYTVGGGPAAADNAVVIMIGV